MNGVEPWLQTHWDWRAAGNFIGGGSGSGLLLATAFGADAPRLSLLLGLALIAAGLSLVWSELGRPFRFRNVFFHPHTSWMTREAIVAMPLFVVGLIAVQTEWTLLVLLSGLLGLGFLYCQARMLQAAKGIPVWRTPSSVALIVVTGLAEGAAILLMLKAMFGAEQGIIGVAVVLWLLIVGRGLIWVYYRRALSDQAPQAAVVVLAAANMPFLLLGHLLPMLALLFVLVLPAVTLPLTVAASGMVMFAGWAIKYIIVTRAAYNQGFAIVHSPARGAGTAGSGSKPGWGS